MLNIAQWSSIEVDAEADVLEGGRAEGGHELERAARREVGDGARERAVQVELPLPTVAAPPARPPSEAQS